MKKTVSLFARNYEGDRLVEGLRIEARGLNMKNVALTLIFYVALGALTWLGFDQGVAGAANVVMFIIWGALLPVALLCVIALLDHKFAVKTAAHAQR